MKPNFKDGRAFSKHFLVVEMRKTEITMDRQVHLGQTILDLVKLCYMDNDSFAYKIETEHFYKEGDWFDERRAWWKNHGRVYYLKSKDLCL